MKARYLLVALAALSCSDSSPVGVARDSRPRADLLVYDPFDPPSFPPPQVGLLICTPVASDSVTQTIGPEGGTIQVAAHILWVPPGALNTAVSITAVAPSDTVNRVRFQPEGLTFQQPAALVMNYANCDLLGSTLPKKIAYTTDALQILEYLPSLDDLGSQTVRGWVRHFSDYAIAW
ncbi:MAG TPA: hypothetical protein VGQ06_07270 [Gemmatimonadales bacterium]|jgi:hypothetical protein|nr:hypothetical protein [Gemmatimonadales bacterium]